MHGQNVMADVSAQSQSFHFGLRLCILTLGHYLSHNLSSNLVSSDPSSDHTMMLEKKVATLDMASAMR